MRIDPGHATFSPDTGYLEVDFTPVLDCRLRFSSWDDGLRLDRFQDGAWHPEPEDPLMPFFAACRQLNDDHPVRGFLAGIPAGALDRSQYCGHFELTGLRLLRHHEAAWDLARLSPNLFWLLTSRAAELRIPASEISEVLSHRMRDVLSWAAGVPARQSVLTFLEKLRLKSRGDNEYRLVMEAVSSPAIVELFRHHSELSIPVLQVVLRHLWTKPSVIRSRFYLDASRRAESTDVLEESLILYRDALRLGRLLGIPNFDQVVASARTVDELRRLHDRWTERANAGRERATIRELIAKYGHAAFPEPPLPGNDDIVPIRTVEELLAEGTEMRHCAGSYAWKCLEGGCSIYRVLAPHRATLELRVVDGRPRLIQLKGPANATPPEECWKAVRDWMAQGICQNPGTYPVVQA